MEANPESSNATPWTYKKRAVPIRVYSGTRNKNNGTIRYKTPPSRVHYWKMSDVQRITDKVIMDEQNDSGEFWFKLAEFLEEKTLWMLERIMPFLDANMVQKFYDFVKSFLAKLLGVNIYGSSNQGQAAGLIQYIADRSGLYVTIKFP